MELDGIKRQYNIAIGLGCDCEVAFQMQKNNIRSVSSPFDWVGTFQLSTLNRIIINRFEGFMQAENMKVEGINDNNCFYVRDMYYNCLTGHEFPVTPNPDDWIKAYPKFKDKMDYKIKRFYEKLESGMSVLFIRKGYDMESLGELRALLASITKGSFKLLAVNPTNAFLEVPCSFDNICLMEVPKGESWEGCSSSWEKLLKGVVIKNATI